MNGTQLDFGPPPSLALVFAIPPLTAVLSLLLAAAAVLAWRKRAWTSATRIHFTAITAAALVFPAFLSYWNLFGPVG